MLNAFSKSISSISPGILFISVKFIKSYISRIFSPIYLPFMNPFYSLPIILSNISFILFAILPDASL